MDWETEFKKIDELFHVRTGDYHATKELDPGNVPLISCGDAENGLVDYYDIPSKKQYHHCLTVAYNGSWPLLSKFHPYGFGAKDDIAVLIPRLEMQDSTLLYISAVLNRSTWRYSYGRKCFKAKLQNVTIPVPVCKDGKTIDQIIIASNFPVHSRSLIPDKGLSGSLPLPIFQWRSFKVIDLLDVERGDFHSLTALDPGSYRTVSRITEDNGTVGYYDIPDGAKVYPKGVITVSTVGGDAFVQLSDFIATDNVLVCTPKASLKPTTLFFIAFALNSEKWRYSYGRQPYKAKFISTPVWLPVDDNGNLDEQTMDTFLKNTVYWSQIDRFFK